MIFIQDLFFNPHSIPHDFLQLVRLLVNLEIKLIPLIVKIQKSETAADREVNAQSAVIQSRKTHTSRPAKNVLIE